MRWGKTAFFSLFCIAMLFGEAYAGRTSIYTEKAGREYHLSMLLIPENGKTLVAELDYTEVTNFRKVKAVDVGSGWKVDIKKSTLDRWSTSSQLPINPDEFEIAVKTRQDCRVFQPESTASFHAGTLELHFPALDTDRDYIRVEIHNTRHWPAMAEGCINCDAGCR